MIKRVPKKTIKRVPKKVFEEQLIHKLVSKYQKTGMIQDMAKIVLKCQPLIDSLIHTNRYYEVLPEEDLRQEGFLKVCQLVPKTDTSKSSIYSFFSICIHNHLKSVVTKELRFRK